MRTDNHPTLLGIPAIRTSDFRQTPRQSPMVRRRFKHGPLVGSAILFRDRNKPTTALVIELRGKRYIRQTEYASLLAAESAYTGAVIDAQYMDPKTSKDDLLAWGFVPYAGDFNTST